MFRPQITKIQPFQVDHFSTKTHKFQRVDFGQSKNLVWNQPKKLGAYRVNGVMEFVEF